MPTQLEIYNNTALYLGERQLATITEDRKLRRLLDQVWDSGFVRRTLEEADWNFAVRTIESSYDPTITPDFGFAYAHEKPSDWVRTTGFSNDDYFSVASLNYSDERDFWFTDSDTIYVRYVSDDNLYGNDLSLWPESFTNYVEQKLAARVVKSLTQSNISQAEADKAADKARMKAKNIDAMNNPTKIPPLNSWVRSRRSALSRFYPRISRV